MYEYEKITVGPGDTPNEMIAYGDWRFTPRWHWRHWLGYHNRRWVWDWMAFAGDYDGSWQYATPERAALDILTEQACPTRQSQAAALNLLPGTTVQKHAARGHVAKGRKARI